MPTYLVHGFRWSRQSIRIHILLHNLEDAAAEWIVAPATSVTLLNSFYTLYDYLPPSSAPKPSLSSSSGHSNGNGASHSASSGENPPNTPPSNDVEGKERLVNRRKSRGKLHKLHTKLSKGTLGDDAETALPTQPSEKSLPPLPTPPEMPRESFNDWSIVKLLEQYNPDDLTCSSQPYAYVADYIVPIDLSIDISAEMDAYERRNRSERGELERGESPVLGASGDVRMSIVGPLTPLSPAAPTTASDDPADGSKKLSMRELKRKSRRLGWFEKLRDSLQKGGDIGWYIVVCGDEERLDDADVDMDDVEMESGLKTPRSAGIKGFFRR